MFLCTLFSCWNIEFKSQDIDKRRNYTCTHFTIRCLSVRFNTLFLCDFRQSEFMGNLSCTLCHFIPHKMTYCNFNQNWKGQHLSKSTCLSLSCLPQKLSSIVFYMHTKLQEVVPCAQVFAVYNLNVVQKQIFLNLPA